MGVRILSLGKNREGRLPCPWDKYWHRWLRPLLRQSQLSTGSYSLGRPEDVSSHSPGPGGAASGRFPRLVA